MSLNITVTWGTGGGPTITAAFDDALCDAGIGDYNILRLSSVIPRRARIKVEKHVPNEVEYGRRLYGVLAHAGSMRSSEVWAGLGWLIDTQTGRGVFAEHMGESEDSVNHAIGLSLKTMKSHRPELDSEIYSKVVGVARQDGMQQHRAISAVVCAVYQIEPWSIH